ncbi:MAG TPA: hypothetical protein PKH07_09920, partial [bacterium]|nr:hypothetical protein [bacterium]
TLTIAPETGSEKVRRQLGKLLTDADILNTASRAIEAGIPSLKLYFLAGVGDLLQDESGVSGESAAIVSLVREIAQRRQEKGSMVVGLSPLVPRYGTPLQSKPLPDRRHVQQVISAVRHGLRDFSGISVRAGGWFEAATEWILSHATAEMSETLMRAGVDTQNRRAILAEEIAKR